MAFNPELSVKVSVDPRIDQTTFSNKLQGAVNQLHNLPNVKLKPDIDNFKDAVKNSIGGPYSVDLNPKFTIDIKDKVDKEIEEVNTTAKKITLKVDIGSFKEDLNTQLRDSLQEVNKKLNYYLKNLTVNSAALNSVVEGFFPKKGISNAIQHELKAVQKETIEALKETKKSVKVFKISDLFQTDDKEVTTTVLRTKQLFKKLKESYDGIIIATDEEIEAPDFSKKFDKFKEQAFELEQLVSSLHSNLSKEKFINLMNSDTFESQNIVDELKPVIDGLRKISKIKDTLTEDSMDNILKGILDAVKSKSGNIDDFCDSAIDSLNEVDERAKEIISERKTAVETTKELATELNKAIADDHSGHLDESEIKTYGAAFDKVLSEIAEKQKEINIEKEKTVNLEDKLLTKSRLNKDVLDKYKKALSSILNKDTDAEKTQKKLKTKPSQPASGKENKSQNANQNGTSTLNPDAGSATIKNFTFDVKEADLQKTINVLFKNISAPIGFIPAKDAIQNLKQKIESELKEISVNATLTGSSTSEGEEKNDKKIPLQGKVELTEEDIIPPKSPVKIPGHVTLTKTDVTVPEEPVDILAKANIVENGENKPSTEVAATVKTENVTVIGDAVTVPTKSVLETKDVVPPIDPVDIKGKVTLEAGDIKVPDKIDLNGNLVIKNATKEIKAATKEAEATVEKEASKSSKKDDEKEKERKRKEYLLSLSSLLKKIATAENKLDEMYPGAENYNELNGYIKNSLNRRKSTTEDLLNKLVGGSDWQNDALYTSAVEDAEHIRASKAADDKVVESIKNGICEEREYISALKQIPSLEEAAADALADFGDKSEHYRVANENLVKAKDTIIEFQEKYGESYSDLIRSEILEQQQSEKLIAKEKADRAALISQQEADNAKRITDEKNYLAALAKEPDLYQAAEAARKKYGDTSQHYQNAQEDYNKNHAVVTNFESDARTHHHSLSDIDGYNDVVSANQRKWLTWNEDTQLAYAAQRKKDAENAKKQQDSYIDRLVKNYGKIEKLQERKVSLFKPEQAKDLSKIDDEIKEINKDISRTYAEAKNDGYDLTGNEDIKAAIKSLRVSKRTSKNEFTQNRDDYNNNLRQKANDEADAEVIKNLISLYAQYDKAISSRAKLVKDEDIDDLKEADDQINKLTEDIIKLEEAAQASGINLQDNEAYVSAFNNSIANKARANKEFSSKRTKYVDMQNDALMKQYEQWVSRMQRAGTQREQANKSSLPWKESSFNKQYEEAEAELDRIDEELQSRGLELNQEYLALLNKRATAERVVTEAQEKRIESQRESIEVTQNEVHKLDEVIGTLNNLQTRLRNAGGVNTDTYNNVVHFKDSAQNLREQLNNAVGLSDSDKNQIASDWANKNGLSGLKDYKEVLEAINALLKRFGEQTSKISADKSFNISITKQKTELANLRSELSDYLKKSPGVKSGLADEVLKLQQALESPNAYQNIGRLKQSFAELRATAKSMGLETENLVSKFKNLFGQHLSTMITMSALHQMQNALRTVYQNVVQIDTALTELKKVSELTGKSLESYMDRAAESAQKLGVSISDYISSTADWKRLGYSDEDAENMATYSTLLKNVGDGIDDVNTSSSYLISTLQGFGLLAKDAEDVVNKIDAVANTQPVTAEAIGEILTRSSAAMSAANNTLDETISLGTAAYAVLQNAESTGTTLKTLSMYLRAAKTDAEDAGIEVDGMANSVSELRSELKSLTGVDIMIDSKNFKSTYQIMKELSEVWGSLSDVTKANVTEMIGGKRNANAVSAILSNFSVAESSMESAADSANVAWEENEKWLDSIEGRLNQLNASFQALSQDVLKSDLVKSVVSLATVLVQGADAMVKFTGAFPAATLFGTFITQLGRPKLTGSRDCAQQYSGW